MEGGLGEWYSSLLYQTPKRRCCDSLVDSYYTNMYILLNTAMDTTKADNAASCRETLMKCTIDTTMVATIVTKECINKVLFAVICSGVMKTTMTSLVAWAGMVGMTTFTADMEGVVGMATEDMMALAESMMDTTIMGRSGVMEGMVGMADTTTTEVSYK